jgi:ferredoxin--NADP+ reductase
VRHTHDLAYREELQELAGSGRGLVYHPVVSRDAAWSGAKGHVQSLFEAGVVALNPAQDSVFLCGNPAMVEGMETLLTGRGYTVHSKKTPGNLHLEKYW